MTDRYDAADRRDLIAFVVFCVTVVLVVVAGLTAGVADAKPNRLPCRDTVSYGTGQALIKDGWLGDPTDGREALYGPRGTCVLIAV